MISNDWLPALDQEFHKAYYRDLFIPIEYVTKELEKSDEVYYMDRWAGKGPRFDSQGSTFTVNNTVRQIIKLIKLQK